MAENVERKKQGLKRQSNRMIPTFKTVEDRHGVTCERDRIVRTANESMK
jgi:hypothetical protein